MNKIVASGFSTEARLIHEDSVDLAAVRGWSHLLKRLQSGKRVSLVKLLNNYICNVFKE